MTSKSPLGEVWAPSHRDLSLCEETQEIRAFSPRSRRTTLNSLNRGICQGRKTFVHNGVFRTLKAATCPNLSTEENPTSLPLRHEMCATKVPWTVLGWTNRLWSSRSARRVLTDVQGETL